MVTIQEKNNLLLQLQCLHGQYGNYLAKVMSIGKCTEKELCVNTKSNYIINTLRRYQVFDEEVTNAVKIDIKRLVNNTDITVDIYANSTLLGTYTGTGSELDIVNMLQNDINSGTNIHNYICFVNENSLYLYSYDSSETYNSLVIGTFTENEIVTEDSLIITSESLENKLNIILDLWNCISTSEKCCLINYLKTKLMK